MATGDQQSNGSVAKAPKEGAANESRVLKVMFVSLLLDLLAFTMILPLLPILLDYYGQKDKGGLYGALQSSVTGFRWLVGAPDTPRWNGVLFGGLIGSLFSLLQFVASPVMGAASDVYGRRPVMLLSTVGIALSYVLWAVSYNFTVFVFARIVAGISKGNVSLSTAIVADVSPPEKRGKGMALVGIAFSVGFLIGPTIGAYFSLQAKGQDGMFFVAPALFALLLAVINIVFTFFFMEETLPAKNRSSITLSSGIQKAKELLNPADLFRFTAVKGASPKDIRKMQDVGLIYFLYLFFYSGLEFTLTFLTYNRFNFNSMDQGRMFCVIGISMIVVQGGFVRRMKPGKEIDVALKGLMVLMPSLIIIGLAYSKVLLYTGLLMYAFASATVVPCLTTYISSYGQVSEKGTVLGIFRSLGALARAVGPVVACTVYWSFGAVTCYTLGSIALVAPYMLLRKLKANQAATHTN